MNRYCKKLCFAVALMTLCFSVTSALADQGGNGFITVFDSKMKRANRHFNNFQYTDALVLFQKELIKHPDNQEAKLKTAECYRMLNQPDQAAKWYGEVIDANYIIEPIYKYYYAQSLMATGEYDQAEYWVRIYAAESSDHERVAEMQASLNDIELLFSDSSAYQLEKLAINSDQSDFAPTLLNDGIVFASSRETNTRKKFAWDKTPFLDLYYSPFLENGSLGEPVNFSDEVNSKYHEGPAAFFEEGQRMLFTRSNYHDGNLGTSADGTNVISMYSASKNEEGVWTNIEPFAYNNKEYSAGHPTINSDGSILYFISDMPNGMGGTDIYRSYWNGSGWGTPQNLGPKVNSVGNEMFPFIDDDGTLYYSSNGKGGLGGLDIFTANIQDDVISIQNMGYPINSNKDDFGLILNGKGKEGYLSTNREGLGDDIYHFKFKPSELDSLIVDNTNAIQPNDPKLDLVSDGLSIQEERHVDNLEDRSPVTSVNGLVINRETYEPIENTLVRVMADGQEQEAVYSDENGRVSFNALPGKDYSLETLKSGFEMTSLLLPAQSLEINSDEELILTLNPTVEQATIVDNFLEDIDENNVDKLDSQSHGTVVNGLVINKETYEPISNTLVRVMADGQEQEALYSDENGRVSFNALPGKDYSLETLKSGFEMTSLLLPAHSLLTDPDEELILALNPADEHPIQAEVVDGETGEILKDAEIKLFVDNPNQEVNYQIKDGTIYFDATPDNDYMLIAKRPGYKDVFLNLSADSLMENQVETLVVELPTESQPSDYQYDLAKTDDLLKLNGNVRDAITDQQLEDVSVKLFANGTMEEVAYTTESGKIKFETLPGNNYMLMLAKQNYQDLIYHIPAQAIDQLEREFDLLMIPQEQLLASSEPSFIYTPEEDLWDEELNQEEKFASGLLIDPDLNEELPKDFWEDEATVSSASQMEATTIDPSDGAQVVIVQNHLGNDKVYLSTRDRLYELMKEGDKTYLVSQDQRIPLDGQSHIDDLIDNAILSQLLVENGYSVGGVLRINNIYYDFDKSNIRKDAVTELDKLVNLMTRHKSLKIAMGSHTDVRGSHAYNTALSQRRADSAVDYLVARGISQDRLTAQNFGESITVNDCVDGKKCQENQHQLNRRTEFRLLDTNDQILRDLASNN